MSDPSYDNERILIVDDSPAIHDDFRKVLTNRAAGAGKATLGKLRAAIFNRAEAKLEPEVGGHFQIDVAQQGQQAAQMVQAALAEGRPYAMAFVDMRMPPGWDGMQTIQELWRLDGELQVVICTAYADQPWEEIDRIAGETDQLLVLKKPFDAVEVKRLAIAGTTRWSLVRQAKVKRAELENVVAERTAELTAARQRDQLRLEQLEDMVKSRTAELRRAAYHDELTGLPNRSLFHDRLNRALAQARESGGTIAVLFIDFDRFKVINDSLGHQAGDRLLKTMAERLRNVLRSSDVVLHSPNDMDESGPVGSTAARLGGDEFCVLLTGLNCRNDAEGVALRIIGSFEKPCDLGHKIQTSASIGIAISENGSHAAEAMVRDADIAMYRAKAAGRGVYAVFDPTMHTEAMERLIMESELRRALERGELRTYYQPVVSLQNGEIRGAEALLRWQHPTRGLVQPGDFIGLSEEIGLISQMGLWVLEDACRHLAQLKQSKVAACNLTVSVNVSGHQLKDPKFSEYVQQVLERTGLPAQALILEITETVLLNSDGHVVELLNQLRALGVRTYLDDFGTGQSSLAVLHEFPLDGLKIDRSFVAGATGPRRYAAIIHSIMALAHNLQMEVVAEGVESLEQVAMLQALGCSRAQGYLFAQPMDGAAFAETIECKAHAWSDVRDPAA